jgi:hypothetical protein
VTRSDLFFRTTGPCFLLPFVLLRTKVISDFPSFRAAGPARPDEPLGAHCKSQVILFDLSFSVTGSPQLPPSAASLGQGIHLSTASGVPHHFRSNRTSWDSSSNIVRTAALSRGETPQARKHFAIAEIVILDRVTPDPAHILSLTRTPFTQLSTNSAHLKKA